MNKGKGVLGMQINRVQIDSNAIVVFQLLSHPLLISFLLELADGVLLTFSQDQRPTVTSLLIFSFVCCSSLSSDPFSL